MKRAALVLAALIVLSGCGTFGTAVRLCGIGALDPRKECVVVLTGYGSGPHLVPRGLHPNAPRQQSAREAAIGAKCGAEALRKQQEHYARYGEMVAYAPLENKCKRRERGSRKLG